VESYNLLLTSTAITDRHYIVIIAHTTRSVFSLFKLKYVVCCLSQRQQVNLQRRRRRRLRQTRVCYW